MNDTERRSIMSRMTMGPWTTEPNGPYVNIRQMHSGKYVGMCTPENEDAFMALPEFIEDLRVRDRLIEDLRNRLAYATDSEELEVSEEENRMLYDVIEFVSAMLTRESGSLDEEKDAPIIKLLDKCADALVDPHKALAWKAKFNREKNASDNG